MTRDDIIRMMRSVCDTDKVDAWHNEFWTVTQDELERFAALVAAEKEQQMIRDGWRQCAKGQRTTQYCGLLDAAVKDEREACCKIVHGQCESDNVAQRTVDAIRARGQENKS